MEQRSIGNDTVGRVSVGAIGLGAMPLSTKQPRPSPTEAEAVVHAALDAGVTLIDTADAYAHDEAEFGHNEVLVANALRSYGRADVLVATKGGHTRRGTDWELDGSPAYLRRACEASLRRLHVDAIGLYQFHRPDPATPWEESMGALRSLHDDGLVRMVGISNATIEQIDSARAIVGDALVSVQNQFSPGWRSSARGLSGRDPFFDAHADSETQTFHPGSAKLIYDTCFGCHGIGGQRQLAMENVKADGSCAEFDRTVTLREITKATLHDILRLKVAPHQEHFVASNAVSLAEAHFEPDLPWYRGVYVGDMPVGFLMLEYDAPDQSYVLWRFMIDARYQKRGIGQKALELVFEYVKTRPGAKALYTSIVPGEGNPGPFYEKMGVVYTGEEDDGELVMRREL